MSRSAFFPQQEADEQGAGVAKEEAFGRAASAPRRQAAAASACALGGVRCGALAGAARQQPPYSGRAVRFPSSRRYLWDRTPAGPQVLVNLLDHVPCVQVAVSAFAAIGRAAERRSAAVPLQLGLSVAPGLQVTALVQELDPLGGQAPDALQLACPLLPAGGAEAEGAEQQQDGMAVLRATLQAKLDQRESANLQQLYAIGASASPAAGLGDAASLRVRLVMPACGMLATPLYTKRLCHVPLAEALLKPGRMAPGQSGYLSMDQARSLLPLEATDANVFSMPLVGVWVKGPSSVLHPLVAAACLRYAYSSLLADRAVGSDAGAFLLLMCPEGDPVSKCFEVEPAGRDLQLAAYRLEATLSPGVPGQIPASGLVAANWAVSELQPQPLPGPQRQAAHGGTEAAALCHSGPAAAVSDSPVLHHGRPAAAGAVPFARSSAPSAAYGVAGLLGGGHRLASAAGARRSLPQEGSARLRGGGGFPLGDEGAWPQPRPGLPARPYGSPELLQQQQQDSPPPCSRGPSASAAASQRPGSQGSPEHREWVQLGEALLRDPPRANGGRLSASSADAPPPEAHTTLGDGMQQAGGGTDGRRRSPAGREGRLAAGPQAAEPPRPGSAASWSERQQQTLSGALDVAAAALSSSQAHLAACQDAASGRSSPVAHAGAARPAQARCEGGQTAAASELEQAADCSPRMGSPLDGGPGAAGGGDGWQPHELAPVSPSVRAGVALSNLALLQHLSTGQLQQALDRVASPDRPAPAHGAAAAAPTRQGELVRAGAAAAAGPPPQPAASPGAAGFSCSPGLAELRESLDASCGASSGAAKALFAATASAQRLPLNPYHGRSLGVQRYAAASAALQGVQEAAAAGWGGSSAAAHWSSCSPVSPGVAGAGPGMAAAAAAAAGRSPELLGRSLAASATAAASTSAALQAAGSALQPPQHYGPPFLGPHFAWAQAPPPPPPVAAWQQDPEAQALQGEVERLRRELDQLQLQLRTAGIPNARATDELPSTPLQQLPGAAAAPKEGSQPWAEPSMAQEPSLSLPPQREHSHERQQDTTRAAAPPLPSAPEAAAEPPPAAPPGRRTSVPHPAMAPPSSGGSSGCTGANGSGPPGAPVASETRPAAPPACSSENASGVARGGGGERTTAAAAGARKQQQDEEEVEEDRGPCSTRAPLRELEAPRPPPQGRPPASKAELGRPSPEAQHRRRMRSSTAASSNSSDSDSECGGDSNSGVRSASTSSGSPIRPRAAPVARQQQQQQGLVASQLPPMPAASSPVPCNPGAGAARPGSAAAPLRSSLRRSLDAPPLVEVVRARCCAVGGESSDEDDREFEERLLIKYGLKA